MVYKPTFDYFDNNRDARPIMDIRMIESDKCVRDVGNKYELLEPLFNWRGVKAGCYKDGNVTVGSCS